jgi:FkbM family methyltransferase
MIQHQGVYLPDGEKHLVEWMTKAGEMVDGRGSYQIKKYRAALAYVRDFRGAVDVGAHCGLWSIQMQKAFDWVYAFEPLESHRQCFIANMSNKSDFTLFDCALGDHDGRVIIKTAATSSGDSLVEKEVETGGVRMTTLDAEFAKLKLEPQIDFMKLDCEGYELNALKGAANMIERCRPVVIVEQKPGRAVNFGLPEHGAVDWLVSEFDYTLAKEMAGDFIVIPHQPGNV